MYADYQAEIHFLIEPQWTPLGVDRSESSAPAQDAGDEFGYSCEASVEPGEESV
jgi:hypothetical protein